MKSKFLKLGLCLAVTLVFSSMEVMAQKNNDWARLGRYAKANKELPAPAKKEKPAKPQQPAADTANEN